MSNTPIMHKTIKLANHVKCFCRTIPTLYSWVLATIHAAYVVPVLRVFPRFVTCYVDLV